MRINLLELAFFSFIIFTYIYLKIRRKLRFFLRQNVPCIAPKFLFGSRPSGTIFLRRHISETYAEMYDELSPYKIGGIYELTQPFYMVCDPSYVQQVLVSSSSHFYDRGFEVDEYVNPLDGNVAFVNGGKYRFFRKALNPIFSPSKLRWMIDDMAKCSDLLMDHIDRTVPLGQEVDLYEVIWSHATNVIASTTLGAELESFNDPFSRQLGNVINKFLAPTFKNGIILFLRLIWPKILLTLKIPTISQEINNFFVTAMKQTLRRRHQTPQVRKDMIHLFMELQNKGEILLEKDETMDSVDDGEVTKIELNEDVLAAQAFILCIGASGSISAVIYGFLYFMALHPKVQEKVRREIDVVKRKYGGLSLDSLSELEYLGCCLTETIRLVTPVPVLPRICTKSFQFPDGGPKLEKGDRVVIPVFSINRDPRYYSDPYKFIPERYMADSKCPPVHPFLSFGAGPKMCIGKRFAELEMKVTLARLLETYIFEPASRDVGRTEMKTKYDPKSFLPMPLSGYFVKLRKI